ncbi:MAG TPA: acetate--CoA ligase family protein [Solirubrobacteraceae bacterium]|nr:acetate--CoA ligase family protein [Solirubrobacteraceae bacterium]
MAARLTADRLERLLAPASVAIVGASDRNGLADLAVASLDARDDVEAFLVNPRSPEAYGRPTYPSLAAIGRPVDAVYALVNAELAVGVVADAAAAGAGGVIVTADGFADPGAGERRMRRLAEAAGDLPLLGPNCNGVLDVARGLRLCGAPAMPIRAGSIGFVTHSGGLIGGMGAAGAARAVGFSYLISTGNELNVGMAECVDFLVRDAGTRAICLAIETLRRPGDFFAAVGRAHAAGKPVIALKLGRSAASEEIAASHTGALTSPGWMYRAALRQHGVIVVDDFAGLADAAVCFDQLDPERWTAARGTVVFGTSGGYAQLAADVAQDVGLSLPRLPALRERLREVLPHDPVENPLDAGGRINGDREACAELLRALEECEDADVLVFLWLLDDAAIEMGAGILGPFAESAGSGRAARVVGAIEDSALGERALALPRRGVAVGRGLTTTLRAVEAMGAFVRAREAGWAADAPVAAPEVPAPADGDAVASEAGSILGFAAAMALLADAGIEIAPFAVVGAGDYPAAVAPPGEGPFVVKLADVPHRTELGAVSLGVEAPDVAAEVERLRALARAAGTPEAVAVQPLLAAPGPEAFLGASTGSELGPMVLWGLGGTLVELGRRVDGAIAPLSPAAADRLLDGLARTGVFDGLRGGEAWSRAALAAALSSLSRLVAGGARWIASIDVNPLLLAGGRAVAVDALVVLREPLAA